MVEREGQMNRQTLLVHTRNQLMTKLLWLFLLISVLINSFVDPNILIVIIPVGLFICLLVTMFVMNKWLVDKTPCLIVTVVYLFFIILVVVEPLFINFMYLWFALILSSIYQQYKPILLAGIYSLSFTIYAFYSYQQEIFFWADQEDIIYLGLFSIFVTTFLVFATKFNENLQTKLEKEKYETEELLRKSEKLAVVGQLAAGVAHEIRNPLAVISGFIQLMREDKKDYKYCDLMLEELNRINLIISEFLVLSKPQAVHLEARDLKRVVSEVVTLLSGQANLKGISINVKQPTHHLYVHCEENQIKQVLVNLIKNAIEAMPNGGNVTIELIEESEDGNVRVMIADEGIGISKDLMQKLGEPFFTTKETGTGLGLMVSLKIIENHRGKVNFSSVVGQGTIVEIDLPRIALE